jgi:hypothetical protein
MVKSSLGTWVSSAGPIRKLLADNTYERDGRFKLCTALGRLSAAYEGRGDETQHPPANRAAGGEIFRAGGTLLLGATRSATPRSINECL